MRKLHISIFSILASLLISFPFIFSLESKTQTYLQQNTTCYMKTKEQSTQKITTCCQVENEPLASSSESFAMFVDDKSFVNKHEEPLAYTFEGGGEKISFKTPDGKEGQGWEFKAKKKTKNYIFVIHEWWGLNDYIKKESENIFNTMGNVNVIALDLYDGQVATTREEAGKYMQSVNSERASAIVKGAMDYVGKKAKIGTIGWCFGGGWSLQASLLLGKQAKACVIYYGMPEKDVEKLKTLNADVLGIFAAQEQWISPKVVAEFEENMKKAAKKVTIKNYDADHAFANPSNPKYNKAFAEEAMAMSIAFFKEKLK